MENSWVMMTDRTDITNTKNRRKLVPQLRCSIPEGGAVCNLETGVNWRRVTIADDRVDREGWIDEIVQVTWRRRLDELFAVFQPHKVVINLT